MTRVMSIYTFGKEALPAALTSPGKRGAPALGPHPGTKTVLAFARSLRWLKSAFHKPKNILGAN